MVCRRGADAGGFIIQEETSICLSSVSHTFLSSAVIELLQIVSYSCLQQVRSVPATQKATVTSSHRGVRTQHGTSCSSSFFTSSPCLIYGCIRVTHALPRSSASSPSWCWSRFKHRSWHRVEAELIFNRWLAALLSACDTAAQMHDWVWIYWVWGRCCRQHRFLPLI